MDKALERYIEYFGRSAMEIHNDPRPRPKLFATVAKPMRFSRWNGHGEDPEFTEYDVHIGTTVRIVMYSRFGDVGVTDDLNAEYGYHARVGPDSFYLVDWGEEP